MLRERALEAQAKAQAKAAAKVQAKAQKAMQAKAKKVESRIGTAISGMRKVVANEHILEVPASVTAPVQSFLETFTAVQEKATAIKNGDVAEWDLLLDSVPYKQASAAEKVLLVTLNQIKKAKELARR